ncbi:MAG TPA: sodium:calcium antiporter [Dehalococcoidia bacterium]|nr:sodium:calcium antiporter [Dehalococcoidia bacterium]
MTVVEGYAGHLVAIADSRALVPGTSNVKNWWPIVALALIAAPAIFLRLLGTDLSPTVEVTIFGIAIVAAAFLLTWASEVAETEISATLALALLAIIAVLPEYAVDIYFAWTAPANPENAHFAIANMTGGNRLLVGFAWPMIFFISWLRTRRTTLSLDARQNSLSILVLGIATVYSFSIPLRGNLSLIDTTVTLAIFGAYLWLVSRMPARQVEEFVGPAAAIKRLPAAQRRTVIALLFLFAAAVIFAAAEPFASGLVHTGKQLGIDEFILVQWLAPLASESPEFLLAGVLAARGRPAAGMTILLSSKVSQWTLLIGSVPAAYSVSGATLSPLDFDMRQAEEVFLTAAQSLFAVAIFVSFSMSFWEAALLAVLFATQLFFFNTTVRIGYGFVYLLLALLVLFRDRAALPAVYRIARETVVSPQSSSGTVHKPPG